ncbi:MAG: OmpA family protein [Puniceicoccales bacterium]|jgi:peptidoglycan-associated lipoprotein|nr:OmpA family protein [Puniceicoccales bacterium]
MLIKYIRYAYALALVCAIGGCSSLNFSPKQFLSPQDTIAIENNYSDEYFINEDEMGDGNSFVAHGFDTKKTKYNYTSADVLESIYFNFDSPKILKIERVKIAETAKILAKDKSLCILVVGNCDKFGKEQYNDILGKRRAEAVRDVFISLGIGENRITTASLGSSKANKNIQRKEDAASDRRCDIVIHTMR